MIHQDRIHGVKAIDSESDLVEVLTNHKWPLCMGFEFDNFLYLNDGEQEDAPEYVALRIEEVDGLIVKGREAGRIRPLDMEASQVLKFIRERSPGQSASGALLKIQAEPDWHHSCKLCVFEED